MPSSVPVVEHRIPAGLGVRMLAQTTATWVLARFGDPMARLLHAPWRDDPYPIYARLRERGPLQRTRLGAMVATTQEGCLGVLRDKRFGVRHADGSHIQPTSEAAGVDLSLLELDPPDHLRLRRLVAPAFRPRELEKFRPHIERCAHDLLDRAATDDTFDLMRDFAAPLPIRAICALLGLPSAGAGELARHGEILGGVLDGLRSASHARRIRESTSVITRMFSELVAQRKRDPGDDLISALAAAPDRAEVTGAEIVQLCGLLLVAGFETTANLIGNAVSALLDRPEQWALVRDDPDRTPAAVEETLRWDPPVQINVRAAHEPAHVAGVDLPAGSVVYMLLGSAGRDAAVHHDPERFDITRANPGEHLAFSVGQHYCLGAVLARMEADIALRCLIARLPTLTRMGPGTRRPTAVIRGMASMPVRSTAVG